MRSLLPAKRPGTSDLIAAVTTAPSAVVATVSIVGSDPHWAIDIPAISLRFLAIFRMFLAILLRNRDSYDVFDLRNRLYTDSTPPETPLMIYGVPVAAPART